MGTPKKHLIFAVVTVAFPFILLAAVEAVLYSLDRNNDRFEFPVSIFSQFSVDGKLFYKVTHPQAYRARSISFPVKKEKGTIRIFCLGGSASAGWPHPPSEIYSEYLRFALQKTFPGHAVEVLNVSGHGFPSYRVRQVYDDVAKLDPDLVIIYSGNNEFLEVKGYALHDALQERLNAIRARLRSLRAFRYLEHVVLDIAVDLSSLRDQPNRAQRPVFILSKIRGQVLDLRKEPRKFKQVVDSYRDNIDYIARDAGDRGIPVLFLTVPVNLRDWHPNVSYNRLSGPSRERWESLYRLGQRALLRNNDQKAVEYFRQAIELEPVHAESYFYLGRAHERLGHFQLALEYYQRARDLDHNPFRALSVFNDSIQKIASRYPGVSFVDLEKLFIEHSVHQAGPGFDLILDYVHPRKNGNLLIAKAVFDKIVTSKLLGIAPSAPFDAAASFPVPGHAKSYDESRDIHLQGALIYLFSAMHQYDNLIQTARDVQRHVAQIDMADESLEKYISIEGPASPLSGKVRELYGKHSRAADLVLEVFPRYLELKMNEILEVPVDGAERAETLDRHRRYYALMESGVYPVAENH